MLDGYKIHNQKLNVTKMRTLRWMSGVTRKYKIRNKSIKKLEMAPIEDKMR